MKRVLTVNDSLGDFISNLSPLDPEEEIAIILEKGCHKGLDKERIFYDLPNPITIQGEGLNSEDCFLRSENCEAFHKDTENRAVITFGMNCTCVTLKGFTIQYKL